MGTKSKDETALAVVPASQYAVMALVGDGGADMRAVLAANVGEGGSVSAFDLERIRIPAGGGLSWSLTDADGAEGEARSFDAVIVGWRDARAYWSESFDESGGGSPPQCSSVDGRRGTGDPGGECASCRFAVFGSHKNGRAQACRSCRMLFVVRSSDMLPMVVSAPPGSLKAVKQYFLRLVSMGRAHHAVVTRFELAREKNQDGIQFSRVALSKAADLSAEEAKAFAGYAASMRAVFEAVPVQPADLAENA